MICSSEEAKKRVRELFQTFNLPANKKYALELKKIFIKYEADTFKRALDVFSLEIYPKSLPNIGKIKKHLENANREVQMERRMEKINKSFVGNSDKKEWREFLKIIMSCWDQVNSKKININDFHKTMASYFDLKKQYDARDMHLNKIKRSK
tara:strand:+ start:3820 stop:4272 length:453 start_codon:yes stop_codon:yes gene_type:complete